MYGKLFVQMYDGTLGTKGPWQALVTLQQLVILADKHGTVDLTPEALSRRTTIPIEIIAVGLAELEKPDPESRSPDEGGRRIVRLSKNREWGWRIVNHGHYRKIRSEDERREYHKLYARKRRGAPVNRNVNTSTLGQQSQPIAVRSTQDAARTKKETTASAPGGADISKRRNGKKPQLESEYAFMSVVKPIWQEFYGGEIPPGSAKQLKPCVAKNGEDEVGRRLRIYCGSTPAPYASIPKFIATFGAYDKPGTLATTSTALSAAEEATIDQILDAFNRAGIFSAMNHGDLVTRCAMLGEEGALTAEEIAAVREKLNLRFCNLAVQQNDRPGLRRHVALTLFGGKAVSTPTSNGIQRKRGGPKEYDYSNPTDKIEAVKWQT